MQTAPQIYILAGPNGAGKTTAAQTLLPELLDCYEYVNADSVAAALSPFFPENVALQSGRLMMERIEYLVAIQKNFCFETTLASRSFINLIKKYQNNGYEITIIYLWLQLPQMAIDRVKSRVEQGGHDIARDVIVRRYHRSIHNFLFDYASLVNNWFFFDNSIGVTEPVAQKNSDYTEIIDPQLWTNIILGVQNEIAYETP